MQVRFEFKERVTAFRCARNPVVQLSFDTATDPTTHVTKAKILSDFLILIIGLVS